MYKEEKSSPTKIKKMSHRNRIPLQPRNGGDCKLLQWFVVTKGENQFY